MHEYGNEDSPDESTFAECSNGRVRLSPYLNSGALRTSESETANDSLSVSFHSQMGTRTVNDTRSRGTMHVDILVYNDRLISIVLNRKSAEHNNARRACDRRYEVTPAVDRQTILVLILLKISTKAINNRRRRHAYGWCRAWSC